MRIFVSSTCYDLLDLRAEVERHLREMGLTPLLSDRPTSEFVVLPDKNSIETCLANVRASDAFICVLSQRYGPRLGKYGFADVSATHLEWMEARSAGKPVHMHVRDRLEPIMSSNTKHPSPNDQRSRVKDPQNPAYEADRANRIEQGHPNLPLPPVEKGGETEKKGQ